MTDDNNNASTSDTARLVADHVRTAAAGRTVNGKPIDVDALAEAIDPARFLDDDGAVDAAKVARLLDAVAPGADASAHVPSRWPDVGQGRRGEGLAAPPPGAEGRAEAERRFGTT